ncbi:MAG: glycoside hydrolase, partial [Clostridia bacterium]|nr:glycoside hydrolase [Clostridia bacterium]
MICLNGKWYTGINRNYTTESNVPGLVYSAMEAVDGTLWYKKDITLPAESFSRASLVLYGAKYQPKVYVNGMLVSSSEGGLTVTRHLLDSRDVKPGNTITLEIELISYTDTPDTDASKLPEADDWRSDLTSHIWNDVYLDLHDDVRIDG